MHPRAVPIAWLCGVAFAGSLAAGTAHAAVAAAVFVAPPRPTSPVTDRADVLSPNTETALARRLASYEATSGHQLVVYLDRSSGDAPIEEFAARSFAAWRLGRAGQDDGLALFVMTDDHALRFEVGYGLEAAVTDLEASAVIRTTMLPLIRTGQWDDAVVRGLEAIVDAIEDRPGSLPAEAADEPSDELGRPAQIGLGVLGLLFVVLLIARPRLALGLLWFVGRAGLGGASGGGGPGGGRSGGGGSQSLRAAASARGAPLGHHRLDAVVEQRLLAPLQRRDVRDDRLDARRLAARGRRQSPQGPLRPVDPLLEARQLREAARADLVHDGLAGGCRRQRGVVSRQRLIEATRRVTDHGHRA